MNSAARCRIGEEYTTVDSCVEPDTLAGRIPICFHKKDTTVPIKTAVALVLLGLSTAAAAAVPVPEIDGALSIQALALLGGVVYLIRRKKK